MAELKDSGERRDFGTGAVRDCAEGKGRCDLLPFDVIAAFDLKLSNYFSRIQIFRETGATDRLIDACNEFIKDQYDDIYTAILDLSKHYEDGAKKYSDRNWENGIPLHCFIDSGMRHLIKWHRGDRDEPHDRAFLWNMVGAVWTYRYHPELDDFTLVSDRCPEYLTIQKEYFEG